MAVVSPLDQAARKEDALKWLEDIRDFQGAAKALPGSRIIRGQRAQGWALQIEGMNMELCANDEGLPLEMSLDQGMNLEMTFDFQFDLELPDALFSTQIPDGYKLGGEEN
jgi:hypothetical protein